MRHLYERYADIRSCHIAIGRHLGLTIDFLAIAYDIWHQWCTTCDSFNCRTCIDAGISGHRHAMNWTRVVKLPLNVVKIDWRSYKQCDRCGTKYFLNINRFEGMECTVCRAYHCCLGCIQKTIRPLHPVCGGKASSFDFLLIRT